jgi:Bacterial Ig-like domain
MKRLVVLLAALLAAVAAVQGSQATFTASATSAGSSFATAAKFAPTVTITAPADGSRTNDTTPTLSGTAGNQTGDSTTVTVKIYSGSSATGTPVQTRSATRSGTSWSTTATTLAAGTYTAQATQTDTSGNTGTSNANTFTIDTTKPTATRVVGTNKAGGTAGKIENGDTLTFTYSEAIDPTSVLSGWNGAATSVRMRFTNSGTNDSITVYDGTGATQLGMGSVATAGNYVSATTNFTSTMALSADGTTITITFGTPSNVQSTAVTAQGMTWSFNAVVKDLAGNVMSAGNWTESDGDVDF